MTFAIGWAPWVGPILGSVLSLAGTAKTVGRGIGLLLAYSAGFRVPFLTSSVALGAFLRFFTRCRPFSPVVERRAGVLLILVGAFVLTDSYGVLNSRRRGSCHASKEAQAGAARVRADRALASAIGPLGPRQSFAFFRDSM